MKKKILLTLVASFGLFTFTSAQTNTAKWQVEPLSIDGNSDDWGGPIRFFNSDSKVFYEYRNDDKNFYLILKTNDQAMQRQMVQAGMKLKFKVKSDPMVIATMEFPAFKGGMIPAAGQKGMKGWGNRSMQGERPDEQQSMTSLNEMSIRPEFMPKDSILIEGFQFANIAVASDIIAPNTICFSKSKRINNEFVYEICIPLREFVGDNYTLEKIATIPFQLQIQINGNSQSGGSGMKGRMHGQGGGMGGPGGGGGMGGQGGGRMDGPGGDGEMGGGEMGERSQIPDGGMGEAVSMTNKTFSAKFYLAVKQK